MKVEIPDFAEAEDKISLQKNYRNWTQIPNCRNWRRRNIKTIAKTEQKYQITEAEGKLKYQIL